MKIQCTKCSFKATSNDSLLIHFHNIHYEKAVKPKARVIVPIAHTFDLPCAHCGELIENTSNGTISWSIYESVPETLKCNACGETSKVPKFLKGEKIEVSK
jgi:hypothetical protein